MKDIIEVVMSNLNVAIEGEVMKAVQDVGIYVDRDKLLKALQLAERIVYCKDCKYWVKDGNEAFGYAMFCDHDCSLGGQGIKNPDDFCSYGERRGDGNE